MRRWLVIFLLISALFDHAMTTPTRIKANQPCEIVLLIDASSSMDQGIRASFEDVMNVVRDFPNHIEMSDTGVRLALVVFAEWPYIVFDLTADAYKIQTMKSPFRPGPHRGTKTHLGLKEVKEVFKVARPNAAKFVILITDGKPYDLGLTSTPALLKLSEDAAEELWNDGVTIFVGFIGNDYNEADVKRSIDNKIARDPRRVLPFTDIRRFLDEIKNQLPIMVFCDFLEICHFDVNNRCMQGSWRKVQSSVDCPNDPSKRPPQQCGVVECEKTCNAWPWREIVCNDINTGTITINRQGSMPSHEKNVYDHCPKTKTTVCPGKVTTTTTTTKKTTTTTKGTTTKKTTTTTKESTTTTTKGTTTTTSKGTATTTKTPLTTRRTKNPKPEESTAEEKTGDPNGDPNGTPSMTTLGAAEKKTSESGMSSIWGWAIGAIVLIVLLILLLIVVAVLVGMKRRRRRREDQHYEYSSHRSSRPYRHGRHRPTPRRPSPAAGAHDGKKSKFPIPITANAGGGPRYISMDSSKGNKNIVAMGNQVISKKREEPKIKKIKSRHGKHPSDLSSQNKVIRINTTTASRQKRVHRSQSRSASNDRTRAPTVKSGSKGTTVSSTTTLPTKKSRASSRKPSLSSLGPTSAESINFKSWGITNIKKGGKGKVGKTATVSSSGTGSTATKKTGKVGSSTGTTTRTTTKTSTARKTESTTGKWSK